MRGVRCAAVTETVAGLGCGSTLVLVLMLLVPPLPLIRNVPAHAPRRERKHQRTPPGIAGKGAPVTLPALTTL